MFKYKIDYDNKVIIQGFKDKNISESCLIIPSHIDGKEVKRIDEFAFSGYIYSTKIKSLKLPTTLKSIGRGAFVNNEIQSLDLKNIELLGEGAFAYNSIQQLTISPYLRVIPKNSFKSNEIRKVDLLNVEILENECFSLNNYINLFLSDATKHIGFNTTTYKSKLFYKGKRIIEVLFSYILVDNDFFEKDRALYKGVFFNSGKSAYIYKKGDVYYLSSKEGLEDKKVWLDRENIPYYSNLINI